MSLFQPIQTTQTQQLNDMKSCIVQNNITALQSLIGVIQSNWILVWENPQGFTPQQIFDQFGTDAVNLFVFGASACTFVETLQPGSIDAKYLSAALPYTINQDGTVTVNSGS